MKKKLIAMLLTMSILLTGKSVTFEWDHSPDPTVTGYRLYWGTVSNQYTISRGISRATNAITITNSTFTANIPYYFVVVATNSVGLESIPSNMVTWTNLVPPSPPSGLRVVVVP